MRILVVDDDYVSRVKLLTLFAPFGQCDSAPNGDLALGLFQEAHKELVPYELVSVDVEMPGKSGQETVHAIREIEKTLGIEPSAAVKIIMVTAHTQIKDVASSYKQGCDVYLTKPTTPDALAGALKSIGIAG